jgi:TilS substrate binding domain
VTVTAANVIEEIKQMPPDEQVEVIRFAVELAKTRQLTAQELGQLAEQLAEAKDPAEIVRLKSAMTRGFYGE